MVGINLHELTSRSSALHAKVLLPAVPAGVFSVVSRSTLYAWGEAQQVAGQVQKLQQAQWQKALTSRLDSPPSLVYQYADGFVGNAERIALEMACC